MNDLIQKQDEEFFAACALAYQYSKAVSRTLEFLDTNINFETKIAIINSLLNDRGSYVRSQ